MTGEGGREVDRGRGERKSIKSRNIFLHKISFI